jgi:hypothetical protein
MWQATEKHHRQQREVRSFQPRLEVAEVPLAQLFAPQLFAEHLSAAQIRSKTSKMKSLPALKMQAKVSTIISHFCL